MFEEILRVQEGVIILPADALMICYTDGLVEQENDQDEEFGIERLAEIGITSSGHSAETINARIMSDFNAFRGETPYIDDTALLTCRFL
jgi:sigma-B regulation protein RsbU (phosphoserine phosphatase)